MTNDNDTERISYLLAQLVSNEASEPEVRELFDLLKDSNDESPVRHQVEQLWKTYQEEEFLPETDWEKMYSKIIETPVIEIHTRKRPGFYRIVAAATVILSLGVGTWFILNHLPKKELVATTIPARQDVVAPQSENAVITLANGKQIALDSYGVGSLAIQGAVKLVKTADGQIAYSGTSSKLQYNTIYNPRGSKEIHLTLADGTRIWLNSESSLRYPTAFIGKYRKVEITGEAYFEVAHNADRPFIVSKGDMDVHVLGTHFNVNAYDDQTNIKVTLLEGSVKVSKEGRPAILVPGQQAQFTKNGEMKIAYANTDEAVAWVHGRFSFEDERLENILTQLSRWYNVDVVFRDTKYMNYHFTGDLPRYDNISVILEMLKKANNVEFNIENKTITVGGK